MGTVLPTNLYGSPRQFSPRAQPRHPSSAATVPSGKAEEQPAVTIWGNGQAQREFLYVDDLVEAYLFLEDYPEVLGPIIIGSSREVTIKELADTIREVVEYSGKLKFDQSKPDGMPLKKVDTSKLDQLGWQSTTSLRDGWRKPIPGMSKSCS